MPSRKKAYKGSKIPQIHSSSELPDMLKDTDWVFHPASAKRSDGLRSGCGRINQLSDAIIKTSALSSLQACTFKKDEFDS